MKNKRLLFITTRRFWPTDSGRKLSLYHYCRGLHDFYGYEIYLYSFLEAGQSAENADEKPYFIRSVTYAKDVSFFIKIRNIVFKSILSRQKMPLQCSLFYSKENVDAIKSLADRISPHAIFVDMVRLAPYYVAFSHLECKKVLDMDDVLSRRYRRQIEVKDSRTNLMGVYAKGIFNRLLCVSWLRNMALNIEACLMEAAEKRYTKIYDSVVLVSEKETEYLNRITGTSKAHTITMGVDCAYFAESIVDKEPNSLCFVGNLKVSANVDSLNLIITKILPLITCTVKLYVIGPCPDAIKDKYKTNDKVVFTGVVNDLREYVGKSQILLSPIVYGSGIKTKILEAMAMGVPVVTNSIGAEGLNVTDGVELYVKDDILEMAKIVNELLRNEAMRKATGEHGQKFVQRQHDWKYIYNAFELIGMQQ